MNNNDPVVVTGDLTSIGIVIASLAGILPAIASLLTIIWVGLRIYETYLNIKKLRNDK